MYTMNRCLPLHSPTARALLAGAACALAVLSAPATALAQDVPPGLGIVRNFPDAALRGTLVINSTVEAQINGQTIRMAPGMRLFSPQNSLVFLHTVIGQRFRVNYVLEASTGMLLSAWILSEGEARQPRKGGDAVERNFRAESDNAPARR
nr:hypothetical protein [Acidovorax sp. Leaf160]